MGQNNAESSEGIDSPDLDPAAPIPPEPTEEPAPDSPPTDVDAPEGPTAAKVVASAPGECSDGAYNTADLKEYGTYNWYMGDGPNPAGLSDADIRAEFGASLGNVTGQNTNCADYATDRVEAKAAYQGQTTKEADINADNTCQSRDHTSTWDAGNLTAGTLGRFCYWSVPTPGAKNDLVEADVRFNTVDADWTRKVTAYCTTRFDIRSTGTHEAGHVFGLKHVGAGHDNLTMYSPGGTPCDTRRRTLGKGDILGLRSIY
ncbi:hypothetical protein K8W59_18455 [Nocardioides rotundus]|uniref:hypothetical protein n=1 Tax=Nocardioides rotundus TaxID=1774216 RepID=UPI001CBD48F4|nr:hypothetical protein [Nocardioides rotundus]UAL29696.1 hypothetical protein K8W59_18455 [Nocardioides rotundus]